MFNRKKPEDRYYRLTITLPKEDLARIDKNIEKLQNFLVSKGAQEGRVKREVSRSSIIREMLSTLSTDDGYSLLRASMSLALGVTDNGQTELFND